MYEKRENVAHTQEFKRLTESEIKLIKSYLRKGDHVKIQDEIGKSRNHVYRVFKGDYYDPDVFKSALKLIKNRTIQAAARRKRLDQALKAVSEIEHLIASY